MVKTIKGDLLECGANLLCHQTNYYGVMGGGIAASIRAKALSKKSYQAYKDWCRECGRGLLGRVQILPYEGHEGQFIVNMFCQDDEHPDPDGNITDYDEMRWAMTLIELEARAKHLSVAFPARIGCGIAGGDWHKVNEMIHRVFGPSSVDCTIVYWDKEASRG